MLDRFSVGICTCTYVKNYSENGCQTDVLPRELNVRVEGSGVRFVKSALLTIRSPCSSFWIHHAAGNTGGRL